MTSVGLLGAVFGALLSLSAGVAAQMPVRLATFEYPPYIVQTGAGAQGLSAELVREAFARMGRGVLIEFYPWNRGVKLLEAGAVDGLFTIKKTPERVIRLNYPNKPLIRQDYVFFVRKGSQLHFDGDLAGLAAATIGVVTSTSYGQRFDEAAARGVFRSLETATSYELIFRMLAGGRVDAVICSRLVGLEFVRRIGAGGLIETRGPPVETALSYLVFSSGASNAALASAFDEAILEMERDGTLNRILARHGALPSKP